MTRNIGVDANIDKVRLKEQASAPSTPATDYGYLYIKSGGLYFKGDDGTEIGPMGVGGGGGGGDLELDYVETGSSVSTTATTEGGATTVLTSNSIALDGSTPIIIEFFCSRVSPHTTAEAWVAIALLEDSTMLAGNWGFVRTPAGASMGAPVDLKMKITPSAGSHVYTVKIYVNTGTGNLFAEGGGATNTANMFLRVCSVG